jgi:hypothetical protein
MLPLMRKTQIRETKKQQHVGEYLTLRSDSITGLFFTYFPITNEYRL